MERADTRIVTAKAFEVDTQDRPPQRVGWVIDGAPEVDYPQTWWAVTVTGEQSLHGPYNTAVEAIDALLAAETAQTGVPE